MTLKYDDLEKCFGDFGSQVIEKLNEKELNSVFNFIQFNKEQIKNKFIKNIKSKDWLVYSNGRSTDYVDKINIDSSIERLVENFEGLFKKSLK